MPAPVDQYAIHLQALLPSGAAWPREPDAVLTRLLTGLAEGLAAVHNRAEDLLAEADPARCYELLPEWERAAGLPDACSEPLESLDARRAALLARLTGRGGQSRAYFIALAAGIGRDIEIEEFPAFCVGSAVGDYVVDDDGRDVWLVRQRALKIWGAAAGECGAGDPLDEMSGLTINGLSAGEGAAGDPLESWGDARLECLINRLKPAHTHVLFNYFGESV